MEKSNGTTTRFYLSCFSTKMPLQQLNSFLLLFAMNNSIFRTIVVQILSVHDFKSPLLSPLSSFIRLWISTRYIYICIYVTKNFLPF